MNEHSSENIIKRLENLRLWQEQQQKLLFDRQNNQREQLGIEQQQMYKMLGLSSLPSTSPASSQTILDECNRTIKDNDLLTLKSSESNNNISMKKGNVCAGRIPNSDTNNEHEVNTNIKKKPFLKRGEGLKGRFKIDPNAFRLNNLPKYKYANTHKKYSQKKNKTNENCEVGKLKKPVVKSEIFLPKIKLKLETTKIPETDNLYENNINITDKNLSSNNNLSEDSKMSFEKNHPISWAKVLDPNNSEPISVKEFRFESPSTSLLESKLDDTDNLSIFELIEQKAKEGNFSLNASNIKKWIQEKALELVKETEAVNADKVAIEHMKKSKISPFPCDISSEIIPDENDESGNEVSYSSDENSVSDDNGEKVVNKQNSQHVRFNEEIQINEVLSETESVESIEAYQMNTNIETLKDKSEFERFKANLYSGNDTTMSDSTLINNSSQSVVETDVHRIDINEKSELLKKRLADLEIEITAFKKHNSELIKFKQDHELQKISLEQERLEMEEKINDEKIKLEIYLHDERMKIEDEKKKLEKLIKDQRTPNRKEREEIVKLREQVENIQKDCKAKETKHISAQARLRAQIRNLEKEVKDLSFDIEHLKKENKKLESENAQLNRQNNNKMLQEINKTIAKLAPKPVEPPTTTEVQNRNLKSVTAKVISHKKQPQHKSKSKTNLNHVTEDYNSSSNDEENIFLGTSSEEENTKYRRKPRKSNKSLDNLKKSSENISNENLTNNQISNHNCNMNFKREIQNSDGSKDIWYPNGNLKKISADGMQIKMLYFNKDIKETNISEGTVKYYYAETNTWHTTYLDGLEILEFPNGQTEHRYKDGTIEVHFPNGSIRISNPMDENKAEEWRYSDGTNLIQLKNGDKILSLPNGQKEIHTKIHKRREYPDGTVKIVYPDGSQETRYSNGRVRLKDKDGILVMDSENLKYLN